MGPLFRPSTRPTLVWGCDQGGRVGAMSRGPACGDATAETRSAADSTDLCSCRKPFGGCGLAADAMYWILAERGSEAAAPKRGAGAAFRSNCVVTVQKKRQGAGPALFGE